MEMKISQGVLSRGISVILHSHRHQQSNSCKQMLPAVTWMGLVHDKWHILDEHLAFPKCEWEHSRPICTGIQSLSGERTLMVV